MVLSLIYTFPRASLIITVIINNLGSFYPPVCFTLWRLTCAALFIHLLLERSVTLLVCQVRIILIIMWEISMRCISGVEA